MKLDKYGLYILTTDDEAYEKYHELFEHVNGKLATLLDGLKAKADAVKASTKFTREGKQEELARIGAEVMEEVEKAVANQRAGFAKRFKDFKPVEHLPTLRQRAEKLNVDPLIFFFGLQELRAHLRSLDPVKARLLLTEAADAGDPDPLLAVESAHPLVRPVPAEVFEEARARWLDHVLPEGAKFEKDTLETMESNVASAKQFAAKETGAPLVEDAIRKQAAADAA